MPDRTTAVETALVVQRVLMRLPVEQCATIVAVDMQGYSIADTAALLGIAEGTVKSRCARGRVRLAQLLGYLAPAIPSACVTRPGGTAGPGMTDTGTDGRSAERSGGS